MQPPTRQDIELAAYYAWRKSAGTDRTYDAVGNWLYAERTLWDAYYRCRAIIKAIPAFHCKEDQR